MIKQIEELRKVTILSFSQNKLGRNTLNQWEILVLNGNCNLKKKEVMASH